MALKRSMFQIKSAVGVSKSTKDVDFKMCETKLKESEKKLKQAFQVASKLPETVQAINVMHIETLRSFTDCVPDDLDCQSLLNEVINIFLSLDTGVEGYKTVLTDQLVQPLNLYLDQWSVIRKRIKVLEDRRIDMDRYHEKVLSITKKAPGKQSGLADAQAKYSFARDAYYFLRNEIMEDVGKLNNDISHIIKPMISTLLVAYTEYLNNINSYWGAVPTILQKLPPGGFEIQSLYTPNEFSMISEANVTNKRRDEGPTQDDDLNEPSNNAHPTSTAPAASKRPPPPPPTRAPSHQVVVCEYDYDAQDPSELSFRQGDRITVLKKEGDWWEGQTTDGRVGLFPSNYVSLV